MYRGLLKYYLVTIVCLFGAIFSADYIYKNNLQHPEHKQIKLSILVDAVKHYCLQNACHQDHKLPFYKVQLLETSDVVFPQNVDLAISKGDIVNVNQLESDFYYASLDQHHIIELGPFEPEDPTNLDSYSIVFFILLGATIFAILWPLFAEMWRIKDAASSFAKNKELSNLKLHNYRFFKPVSDTLDWMLNKIARLLALQMELTSTLSHELRTNIANMKFSIANLNEKNVVETKQQLRQDVNEITELLDQYLSFAKQEHEVPELNIKTHYLSQTVGQYLDKVKQFSDKMVSFDIYDEEPIYVDMAFFSRAIKNIIDNAFKYSNSRIAVQLYVKDDQLTFQVDDDGLGLNADSIDELFIPFTRKTQTQFGYGLGLAITKKILHWHKWQIHAEPSELLGGACFKLSVKLHGKR